MPFADILLRVDPTAETELERLAVAVDLSQRLQVRLDGVFVASDGPSKANWAQTLFTRAVSRSPLETTWRVLDGHSNAALLFQARRCDLSILPCSAANRGESHAAEQLDDAVRDHRHRQRPSRKLRQHRHAVAVI